MHATSIKRDENGVVSCTGDVMLRRQTGTSTTTITAAAATPIDVEGDTMLGWELREGENDGLTCLPRAEMPPGSSQLHEGHTLNFRARWTRRGALFIANTSFRYFTTRITLFHSAIS